MTAVPERNLLGERWLPCDHCGGTGFIKWDDPDVYARCEQCADGLVPERVYEDDDQ